MAAIEVRYAVDLIESERGWGQKVDDTYYFDEELYAQRFITKFNDKNDKSITPDWYMYATESYMVQQWPQAMKFNDVGKYWYRA